MSKKDDLRDAIDASMYRNDYERVYKLALPLAEQGDNEAQCNLGFLYSKGLGGVAQDYKESFKWYRLAAEQGDYEAQDILVSMYYNGQGVPQDYVLAHMWLNLYQSVFSASKSATRRREFIEKKMTPSQIEEAQILARNWKLIRNWKLTKK